MRIKAGWLLLLDAVVSHFVGASRFASIAQSRIDWRAFMFLYRFFVVAATIRQCERTVGSKLGNCLV